MDNLAHITSKEIDGQKLYFFEETDWKKIINQKKVADANVSEATISRLVNFELPLFLKYEDLYLAGGIGGFKPFFIIYSLLHIKGYFQRIELRGTVCRNCDWKGVIGNPNVSDIYLGISSEKKAYELMREANRFERKKCPMCDTDFNQAAIWVGELPEGLG